MRLRFVDSGTIGAFLEGATDTTSMFLRSLLLMLVAFPDAQAKAQQEIDAVVGSERAPVPSDLERLPYVRAIIKEVSLFANRSSVSENLTGAFRCFGYDPWCRLASPIIRRRRRSYVRRFIGMISGLSKL